MQRALLLVLPDQKIEWLPFPRLRSMENIRYCLHEKRILLMFNESFSASVNLIHLKKI